MRTACIIAALILGIGILPVQAQMAPEPAAFYIDFGIFAGDSTSQDLLEIYYQIYLSRLLFVREEGNFSAKYTVSAADAFSTLSCCRLTITSYRSTSSQ